MDFILDYWYIIIAAIALVAVAVIYAVKFCKLPSDAQRTKIREWLLYAVTEAEKQLGGGTGQLKLRLVYDMFLSKFGYIARLISFETFSELVDEALVEMRDLLDKNDAVAEYVVGE